MDLRQLFATSIGWPERISVDDAEIIFERFIAALKKDPQATVDALVAAGVLKHRPIQNGYWFDHVADVYYVPKPHVHDWTVGDSTTLRDQLRRGRPRISTEWNCSCGEQWVTLTEPNPPMTGPV